MLTGDLEVLRDVSVRDPVGREQQHLRPLHRSMRSDLRTSQRLQRHPLTIRHRQRSRGSSSHADRIPNKQSLKCETHH